MERYKIETKATDFDGVAVIITEPVYGISIRFKQGERLQRYVGELQVPLVLFRTPAGVGNVTEAVNNLTEAAERLYPLEFTKEPEFGHEDGPHEQQEKTIVLGVRVDYTTEGRDPCHDITAAELVVRDHFPTIENGVRITSVEVLKDGERILTAHNE